MTTTLFDLPEACFDMIFTNIAAHDGTWQLASEAAHNIVEFGKVSKEALSIARTALGSVFRKHIDAVRVKRAEYMAIADSLRYHLRNVESNVKVVPENVEAMNLAELRQVATDMGYGASGSKAILVQRIMKNVEKNNVCMAHAGAVFSQHAELNEAAAGRCKWEAASLLQADRDRNMTASQAKETYGLTPNDLKDLPCERRNPVYRYAPPMRLYCVVDLAPVARQKYGSTEQYAAVKEAKLMKTIEQKARKRECLEERKRAFDEYMADKPEMLAVLAYMEYEPIQRFLEGGRINLKDAAASLAPYAERLTTLKAALLVRGVELRYDSRLCDAYVMNGTGNPESIAVVMEEMRFYYSHTNYSLMVHHFIDEAFADIGRGEWQYALDQGTIRAKHNALQGFAKRFGVEAVNQPLVPESIKAKLMFLI
jgi:hypothetical protein